MKISQDPVTGLSSAQPILQREEERFRLAGWSAETSGVHQVIAKAYDNPIPGYKTSTVGNLRLWEALPLCEFDLDAFNKGEYDKVRATTSAHPSTPCSCWGAWAT